jgi:hypothetical protein
MLKSARTTTTAADAAEQPFGCGAVLLDHLVKGPVDPLWWAAPRPPPGHAAPPLPEPPSREAVTVVGVPIRPPPAPLPPCFDHAVKLVAAPLCPPGWGALDAAGVAAWAPGGRGWDRWGRDDAGRLTIWSNGFDRAVTRPAPVAGGLPALVHAAPARPQGLFDHLVKHAAGLPAPPCLLPPLSAVLAGIEWV